ncbi:MULTISPECIES: PP2C family serine/threonine-protein phosphatase [unclassified Actinomyces]|uniref:PP2C family protein-serine/threonine phosphatase n=1 Tax=unclassified Actinomyces TaxID=2609248 RepID=UPI002016E9E7|nr:MULTISPECIES: PP2C family serine/threonine-protein phosphatase [unclassified Actinomyces]MCL3777352.1 serine/threonine-protein phosphatase [Actinomyces sp. AC-20-1]MCL3790679.1 serine/threonine-protein phosphatase [Actinomyces sp. 187325]MCL3792986.1 serine/threonine-protein phosphatase [Actinomyces sp. 186855]MCL3793489.1 serine/threonine-protein phosphatase [Actinomyces sp. 217892]
MTTSLRYAARSSVGLLRASNQDSGYAGPHLMVLCDGMGGPAGGDIASAVAIDHLSPLDADSHQAGELLGLLRTAVQDAHQDLMSRSASDPALAGLGTTCIAIMRSGNKLAMVHVGDSRAYLLRDGELTQVTTDHTFVEYLVETGRLTREQARQHPQRSVLLRVLGDAEGDVQLDESIREAVPGDRWLLCSDGLSGPVSAETIKDVLTSVADPEAAAEELIDLAERAGGPDNITAVIFDVVDTDEPAQTGAQVVGSAAQHRERADAPEPRTPAAKAAALVAGLEEGGDSGARSHQEEALAALADSQARLRRARRRRAVLSTLVLVVALAGALVLGYRWTQTQFYVSTSGGKVAIFQGIPQELGPVSLSHLVETYSEPPLAELDERMRQRLEETVSQPSLEAAREYVSTTVAGYTTDDAAPSSSATPSAGATATGPASPSPSPTSSPTASPTGR